MVGYQLVGKNEQLPKMPTPEEAEMVRRLKVEAQWLKVKDHLPEWIDYYYRGPGDCKIFASFKSNQAGGNPVPVVMYEEVKKQTMIYCNAKGWNCIIDENLEKPYPTVIKLSPIRPTLEIEAPEEKIDEYKSSLEGQIETLKEELDKLHVQSNSK